MSGRKDVVAEGMRTVVDVQPDSPPKRLADLMKKAQGVVRSGIPDLGSNPDHLSGFGRNARRHR
jgi:hypothetical protein